LQLLCELHPLLRHAIAAAEAAAGKQPPTVRLHQQQLQLQAS
jgi:hypothetical protein